MDIHSHTHGLMANANENVSFRVALIPLICQLSPTSTPEAVIVSYVIYTSRVEIYREPAE